MPRDAWDRAPWNRWSYQNVPDLLPTALISRGTGPVRALPVASGEGGAIAFRRTDGQRTTVDALLEATGTDGFLVLRHGRLIHESYRNAMTARTLHLVQSVTKSVVATAAGTLVGAGRLDPMAPIAEYLPELARTAWDGATVRQVLDMTTGVRFVEDYDDPASDMGRTDVASGWKLPPTGAQDWPGTLWDQILGLTERTRPHGVQFSYRSIESDVLGLAMARIEGQPVEQVLSARLWAPMGAETDARITVDPAGAALCDAGLCATLGDLGRFGLLILEDGAAQGRQVVPADWIADIRRGDHGLLDAENRRLMPNGCFRNMFWVEDRARETVMCHGIYGQLVYVSPEEGLVAVKLSSASEPLCEAGTLDTLAAIRAIGQAFSA